MKNYSKAFTLVEMIIAILIVAVLAAVAIPKYISITQEAVSSASRYTVGSVQEGIRILGVSNAAKDISPMYPATLDSASLGNASGTNVFFSNILQTPVTDPAWEKTYESLDSIRYLLPTGEEYVYYPASGDFVPYTGPIIPPGGITWGPPWLAINPVLTQASNLGMTVQDFLALQANALLGQIGLGLTTGDIQLDAIIGQINNIYSFTSMEQTADGGYVLLGYYYDDISRSAAIKMDKYGNIEWAKSYAASGENYTYPYSIQPTSDGGYMIAETVYLSAGGYAAQFIKTDSSGNVQWDNAYTSPDPNVYLYDVNVKQTSDGGYIALMNSSTASPIIMKLDSSGGAAWSQSYNSGGDYCWTSGIDVTPDGGYVISGTRYMNSTGAQEPFMMKVDSSGTVQSAKTYVTPTNYSYSVSSQLAPDGGSMMGYYTYDQMTGKAMYGLTKTGSSGDVVWNKTFASGDNAYMTNLQATSDGGAVMVGYSWDNATSTYSTYVVKAGSDGSVQWSNEYAGAYYTYPYKVRQTSDGGYMITGYAYDQVSSYSYLIKTDPEGNVVD